MKSYFTLYNIILFAILIFGLVKTCASDDAKKSVEDDNRDDNGETNDEGVKDESLDIPADSEPSNVTCSRRQNSQMHEIRTARLKQFPFMASVMSPQNEHLCSGVVVSNGLILTTATCLNQPISHVLLDTIKARKNDTTVSLHIFKSEKFPTYSSEPSKDIGLIYTEKHNNSIAAKIKLSNFTGTRNIVDMEIIGFGLNADVGAVKDLQYVGVENRIGYNGFPEVKDILHGYIDCLDTKVLTCFKDTGGPCIFNNELIGIIIKGTDICIKEMGSSYALNKKLVDALPVYTFKTWLDEKIRKNEVRSQAVALATFPNRPPILPQRRMMNNVNQKQPKREYNSYSGQQMKRFTIPFAAIIFFIVIFLI